jgi:hypothetical protein
MILSGSETVKAKEQNQPFQENITFVNGDTANLAHPKIVPDSVVVAGDSSLGLIYVENVDYHIDYNLGTCRRISSGSIPQGGGAVIWYLAYRVFGRGVDYDFDYQKGAIRRRSSGAIESEQKVLIDYTTEYSSLDDESIENAIVEASEQITSFIDESYRESSDRALVMAETYLAVSIICRIRAMESMSPSKAKTGNDTGSWAAVSDMYRKEAFNIMAKFAGRSGAFKSPAKA